jgi:hypothetical protein
VRFWWQTGKVAGMIKVKIEHGEWYPVFYLHEIDGDEVNVPEETVQKWRRIEAEFDAMQDEMRKITGYQ